MEQYRWLGEFKELAEVLHFHGYLSEDQMDLLLNRQSYEENEDVTNAFLLLAQAINKGRTEG